MGDAGGVDTVVASVAEADGKERTVLIVPFRSGAGRAGGLLRNPDVVRWARRVACFWSGERNHAHPDAPPVSIGSTGTSHAGFWALLYQLPLTIYSADGSYVHIPKIEGGLTPWAAPPESKREPVKAPPSLRPPDPPSPDGSRPHLRPAALPFV